jgi:hypothetical protein
MANQKRHLQPAHAKRSQRTHSCCLPSHTNIAIKRVIPPLFKAMHRNVTYIVVHDQSSDYDNNECPTDPDIAGLGVGPATRRQALLCS